MKLKYAFAILTIVMFNASCSTSNYFNKEQAKGLKHYGKHYTKEKTVADLNVKVMETNFTTVALEEIAHDKVNLKSTKGHQQPYSQFDGCFAAKDSTKQKKSNPWKLTSRAPLDDHIKAERLKTDSQRSERKAEGFGVVSAVLATVAWLLPTGLGVLFFVVALIFAIISLSRIMINPDKYIGIFFAISGFVLSLTGLTLRVLLLD